MKDEDRLRDALASIYEMKYRRQGKTLDELSSNIGISKAYCSMFLNNKLPSGRAASPRLLQRVRRFVKMNSMSSADERLLLDIHKLLDRANDEGSVLAALLSTRGREATD